VWEDIPMKEGFPSSASQSSSNEEQKLSKQNLSSIEVVSVEPASEKELVISEQKQDSIDNKNETRTESRAFSKEHSSSFRKKLANEILDMRRKYRVDIPLEHEENAEKRAKLNNEFETSRESERNQVAAAQEAYESTQSEYESWEAQKTELDNLQADLDKRKSSMWSQLFRKNQLENEDSELISRRGNLPREIRAVEIDTERQNYERKNAAFEQGTERGQRNLDLSLSKIQDTVIDDAWAQKAKGKMRSFYENQIGVKQEWEMSQRERSIGENSLKHNVVFLHGIPFGETMGNTEGNNPHLKAAAMTGEEKTLFLAGLEPTISVSSFQLDKESPTDLQRGGLAYKTGVILSGGTIMSAYAGDGGSMAESLTSRHSKYDPEAVSNVQKNISENVSIAIEGNPGISAQVQNEFVVSSPKISALYIYDELPGASLSETLPGGKDAYAQLLKVAEKLGVPIVRIDKSGKMENLFEAKKPIHLAELTGSGIDYSPEERTTFVEEGYQSEFGNEKTSVEVRSRLAQLNSEFPEVSTEMLDRRQRNSSLAKARMNLFQHAA
jgi:hypothetical protein